MAQQRSGAFHFFRFAGIDVYIHYYWLIFAVIAFPARNGAYTSPIYNLLEYLGLFAIVLLHEFGHSFACRSVGGEADEIMLWPLGGIAYVTPPQRPGATLWSIAAGPLVNVALIPVFVGLVIVSRMTGFAETMPDAHHLLRAMAATNLGLLIFNLLPIYPLDGGQMLRSFLWYFIGRSRSLMVTAVIGFIGVAGLVVLAISKTSLWLGLIAFFAFSRCMYGWKHAQYLAKIAAIPRRMGFACPSCKTPPPIGDLWPCQHCGTRFDLFLSHGACPNCNAQYKDIQCLDCQSVHNYADWANTKPDAVL